MDESPDGDYLFYEDVKSMFLVPEEPFDEKMNRLTVEVNRIGMNRAIDILREAK